MISNVTQALLERDPFTNAGFYLQATEGLLAKPAGPGSEHLPEIPHNALNDARALARWCQVTGW